MSCFDKYKPYIWDEIAEKEEKKQELGAFIYSLIALNEPEPENYLSSFNKTDLGFVGDLLSSINPDLSFNGEKGKSDDTILQVENIIALYALNDVWDKILSIKEVGSTLLLKDIGGYYLYNIDKIIENSEIKFPNNIKEKNNTLLNIDLIKSLKDRGVLSVQNSFEHKSPLISMSQNIRDTFDKTLELLNMLNNTAIIDWKTTYIRNKMEQSIQDLAIKLEALYRPAFQDVVKGIVGFDGNVYTYDKISKSMVSVEDTGGNSNSLKVISEIMNTYRDLRGLDDNIIIEDNIPLESKSFSDFLKVSQFLGFHWKLANRHIPYFTETKDGKYNWHSKRIDSIGSFKSSIISYFLRPLYDILVFNGIETFKVQNNITQFDNNSSEVKNKVEEICNVISYKLRETAYVFNDFEINDKKLKSIVFIGNDMSLNSGITGLSVKGEGKKVKNTYKENYTNLFLTPFISSSDSGYRSTELKVFDVFHSARSVVESNASDSTYFKLKFIVNPALEESEISFAYKQYNPLYEAGVPFSANDIIIGKDTKTDVPVRLALAADDAIITTVMAGSGSGKGVLTLAILATLLLSKKSVIYADFKPDMAGMLWDIAKKENTPIYAIDGKGKETKVGQTGFSPAFNFDDDLHKSMYKSKWANILGGEDKNAKMIPYLKTMQLFAAQGLARMNMGIDKDKAKRVLGDDDSFLILDEAQMANTIYSGAISKVYDYLKKNKKDSGSDEYKRAKRFQDVFIDALADEMKDLVITTGRVSKMHILIIGQQTDPGQWGTPQGIWKQCTFGYMVGNLKYKLQGPRAGSSPTYSINKDKLGEDAKLTRGYWVLADNARADQQENVQLLKSYLILNENDYRHEIKKEDGSIQKLTRSDYGKQGPFVQGLFKGVSSDEGAYNQLVADVTLEDGKTPRPEVGFAGMLDKYVESAEEKKAMLSKSYIDFTNFLVEAGIVGPDAPFSSLEEYLYSYDDEYFFTANELKDAFYFGLDSIKESEDKESVGKMRIDKVLPELFKVQRSTEDISKLEALAFMQNPDGGDEGYISSYCYDLRTSNSMASNWCKNIEATLDIIKKQVLFDCESALNELPQQKEELNNNKEIDPDLRRDLAAQICNIEDTQKEIINNIDNIIEIRKLYLLELKKYLDKNQGSDIPIFLNIPDKLKDVDATSFEKAEKTYRYNYDNAFDMISIELNKAKESIIALLRKTVLFDTNKLKKLTQNELEGTVKPEALKLIDKGVEESYVSCSQIINNTLIPDDTISRRDFERIANDFNNLYRKLKEDLYYLVDKTIKEQVGLTITEVTDNTVQATKSSEKQESVDSADTESAEDDVPISSTSPASPASSTSNSGNVGISDKENKLNKLYEVFNPKFENTFKDIELKKNALGVKQTAKKSDAFKGAKIELLTLLELQYAMQMKPVLKFFDDLEKYSIENSLKEEAKKYYKEKYESKFNEYKNIVKSMEHQGESDSDKPAVTQPKIPQASMVNGHIVSDINTDDITYNVDDLDDIGNIKAVGQISEKIIQDIKHQYGGMNNIKSIVVNANGALIVNQIAYKPNFSSDFVTSLGLGMQEELKNGKITSIANVGMIIDEIMGNNIYSLSIEDQMLCDSVPFQQELGIKNYNYGSLFRQHKSLQVIYLPNEELTRNNPQSANRQSIGGKLSNLFGFGRGDRGSAGYVPSPAQSSGPTLVDRMFDSKPVRILTGAFGWTMGIKAVTVAATLFGPWGLIFGGIAAASAYKEIKNDRNNYKTSSRGSSSSKTSKSSKSSKPKSSGESKDSSEE